MARGSISHNAKEEEPDTKNQKKEKRKKRIPRTQPNPRAFRTHTTPTHHQASCVSRKLDTSTKRHSSNGEHGGHGDEKKKELMDQKRKVERTNERKNERKNETEGKTLERTNGPNEWTANKIKTETGDGNEHITPTTKSKRAQGIAISRQAKKEKCVGIKKIESRGREEPQNGERRTKEGRGWFQERRVGEKEKGGSTIRRRGCDTRYVGDA